MVEHLIRYDIPVLSVNWSKEASGQVGGDVANGAVMVETGVDAFAVVVPVRLAEALVPELLAFVVVADSVTVCVTVATLLLEEVRGMPFWVVVSTIVLVVLLSYVRVVANGTPTFTAAGKVSERKLV